MYSFERPKNEGRMKQVMLVPLLKLFIHLKLQNYISVKFYTGSLHVILFKTFFIKSKTYIFF